MSPVTASARTLKFPPQMSSHEQAAHRPFTWRFFSFSLAMTGLERSVQIALKGLSRMLPKLVCLQN